MNKEYFYDLIINEDLINYKIEINDSDSQLHYKGIKNACIKSDWSQSNNNDTTQIREFCKRKRLYSSGVTRRRYGQQLYPKFFDDSRASTANTRIIKKRQERRLNSTSANPMRITENNEKEKRLAIRSREFNMNSFKSNIDCLHRKTLTSKFADVAKMDKVFIGDRKMFDKARPKNIRTQMCKGKLMVRVRKTSTHSLTML